MSEPIEPTSGEEVDAALYDVYQELIDENANIVHFSREISYLLHQIEQKYVEQIERCREARALVAQGALIVAGATADVLAAEWGLVSDEDDDPEHDAQTA